MRICAVHIERSSQAQIPNLVLGFFMNDSGQAETSSTFIWQRHIDYRRLSLHHGSLHELTFAVFTLERYSLTLKPSYR
jgi:hypothetical protein